jgi:hypothetical protein
MDWFVCNETALEFWRWSVRGRNRCERPKRTLKLPIRTPDSSVPASNFYWGLAVPFNVMVGSQNARVASAGLRCHVYSGLLNSGCFLLAGDGLIVSSPEFCFLQMAGSLPLAKLIQLGYELCGSYSLPAIKEETGMGKGFENRPPLTSVARLKSFVAKMPRAKGRLKAIRALNHIADNSASPMETNLTMLLTLPYKLGGYGLPMPELNSTITPARSAKRSADKSHYRCDLLWPDYLLAAEYDSDQFHTGADRIASDSKRRNLLSSVGVLTITITREQIKDAVEFEKAVRLLASNLGKRLQFKNPPFVTRRKELRRLLFLP